MQRAGSDPPLWGVLRALTGHFDPSTVFTIIADSRSFHLWQQELQMCKNLLFLNVSRCGLSTLNVLAGLARLKYLDISHNNIVRVDQIHKLKALETLKAFANHIRRFQDLRDLSGLPSLTTLYLQKAGGCEACPVCNLPDYKSRVLCLLPRQSSSKDVNSSAEDSCINSCPPEERDASNFNNDSSSDNHLPPRQREVPSTDLPLNRLSLMEQTDGSLSRLTTRLRVLDGMRVQLPDWNEQAEKIRRHVLQQEESIRRLRAAVAEMCCTSVYLPQGRHDEPSRFPEYEQKVAGLQAAFATAKETLEALRKLKELTV